MHEIGMCAYGDNYGPGQSEQMRICTDLSGPTLPQMYLIESLIRIPQLKWAVLFVYSCRSFIEVVVCLLIRFCIFRKAFNLLQFCSHLLNQS